MNFLLITAVLTVQGCALAAPAALSYGVSKLNTTPTAAAPSAPELRTYPEYVTAMERINTEREKAGLDRRPIMTQDEWVCAQQAGSAAPPAPNPAPTAAQAAPPLPESTTSATPAATPVPVAATPPAAPSAKVSEPK